MKELLNKGGQSASASASIIAYFFNYFFQVGQFPLAFKFADVISIPKCSKPLSPENFRPIAMLPVLSKVMEKIVVSKRILPTIKSKLQPSQFAYIPRSGGGAASALTLINHHILKFLDLKSGAVRVVAADFSKAFDKLTFEAIFSALLSFNLCRESVRILFDFLCGRRQRVRFNNSVSEWSNITSGVPQGSVIGPILFAMVIDSLSPIHDNSIYVKYADDVTVLHFVRSEKDDFLQSEWSHIENWSKSVGLYINYDKSCVMNCVTKKVLTLNSITTNNDTFLSTVTSLRLLGVTFSENLCWNLHVDDIVRRCYRRFFILRNLRRAYCPPVLIHKCYVLFIRSVLLYCFTCFCNLPKYLFQRLLQVEKRAAKFFPFYQFSNLQISADDMCIKFYQKIHDSNDHPLRSLFRSRTPTIRNPTTLRVPFAKTTRFNNSFIRFGR